MVLTKFSAAVALLAIATLAPQESVVNATQSKPRVDARVHRTLRQQGTVNLMVTMTDGVDKVLESVQEASFDNRGAKIQALVEALQRHAESSQSEVARVASQESGRGQPLYSRMERFWITNQVYFKDASLELLEKLASLSSVSDIAEEEVIASPSLRSVGGEAVLNVTSVEWGVAKIQATDVWAKGYTSQGIVVGGIDTGVRPTHEVLKRNWRESYGWFDGMNQVAAAFDDDGHGTHTLGTAVGALGVGVAPGAQWIGCRACDTNVCTLSAILACGQFMTCPTDPSGQNADCSKAPHVVNNSWGGSTSTYFNDVIAAWTAAGIIPVFSAGNSGLGGCKTLDYPGELPDVISVGATTSTDGLGRLSSKGPSSTGLVKPDLTAPGINVRSATYTSDTAYKSDQGTSMAAPHVAGVIALMLSANKSLTFAQVRSILTSTTDTLTLTASGFSCGGTADTTFPNNQFGYGRVNAFKAVDRAIATA